jgi:hypothetical protein
MSRFLYKATVTHRYFKYHVLWKLLTNSVGNILKQV